MNSKGHLICSLLKSLLRILGTISVIVRADNVSLLILGWTFFLAEILGIVEEVVDKRE